MPPSIRGGADSWNPIAIPVNDCTLLEQTALALRLALGVLLVATGALKLRDRAAARAVFEVLGLGLLARPAVAVLIGLELVLGALLFSGWQSTVTLVSTTVLFLMFIVALEVLRRREYDGGCACFGGYAGALIGPIQIARNVVFVSAAAFAAAVSVRGPCVGLSPVGVPLASYATAGFVLLAGATAYILISRAAALLVGSEPVAENSGE
jgi:hypothetical protein